MKYLLLLLPLLFVIHSTAHYDREQYLWAELYRTGGCAFADCPTALQEQTVKEMHGSLPPQYYKRYSKEWWRAYCSYSSVPEECRY